MSREPGTLSMRCGELEEGGMGVGLGEMVIVFWDLLNFKCLRWPWLVWLSWLKHCPTPKGWGLHFWSGHITRLQGSIPGWGMHGTQSISLSLCLSLPLPSLHFSLKSINIFKKFKCFWYIQGKIVIRNRISLFIGQRDMYPWGLKGNLILWRRWFFLGSMYRSIREQCLGKIPEEHHHVRYWLSSRES